MGIKTGMSAYGYKRCPYVCMLQVDYASYTISKQVYHIMNRYSHQIERYWIEYFMDAIFGGKEEPQIRTFAQQLQRDILETTGLYGSIGIADLKPMLS